MLRIMSDYCDGLVLGIAESREDLSQIR